MIQQLAEIPYLYQAADRVRQYFSIVIEKGEYGEADDDIVRNEPQGAIKADSSVSL